SRLADMLTAVDEVCARHNVQAGHVFHAGDGNLHPVIMCDARDEELMGRVFAACDEIIELCVDRKGSITGEHGVGIEKRRFMPAMYSGSELAAMLDLKAIFDPDNLLNPGKIFPDNLPAATYAAPESPSATPFAPTTAAEAAAAFVALGQQGQKVRIVSQTEPADATAPNHLTTRSLSGIQEFAPADLYVTVGTGTTVAELTDFLREHKLQTALVSPWPDATVGSLLASNVNSPQRTRYGALRDNLLSTTVALADGRVIQAGRVVVKNVAGYDLPKLFVGSQGTLGLMTDATLKLYPLPRAQASLYVPVDSPAAGIAVSRAIARTLRVNAGLVLCPAAVLEAELDAAYGLVMTAEGIAEDVQSEVRLLHEQLGAVAPMAIRTSSLSAVASWQRVLNAVPAEALLVRVGVPNKTLGTYLSQIDAQLTAADGHLVDLLHGLLYLYRIPETASDGVRWLDGLRQPAATLDGYAAAMAVPASLQGKIDRWALRPAIQQHMVQLQQRWDPHGILECSW
ncbi:MAG TPA: FAD-linked oxidase C-terminal domain-containing protein, partial [Caldilineaceae bacterium]|nr:FAD-linked oxidase C-terminal domain-containing protein [Caldilineaceae bacterium]